MSLARTGAAMRLADSAPLFAALGDRIRLRIVARLSAGGPRSIVQLTDVASVTRQAITKHLRALERAGLVSSRRVGRERLWTLQARRLAEVRRYLDQISAEWDRALGRLQEHVMGHE